MASLVNSTVMEDSTSAQSPYLSLAEFFFPGFSMFSGAMQKYLHIDLNIYVPLILSLGAGALSWRYFSEYFWDQLQAYFMSHVDCPTNDESYNFLMHWVASQKFAKRARRFMVNTNLNSRSWFTWNWDDEEDNSDEDDNQQRSKKKALQYTPTFGSHFFWYKNRLLIFRRQQNHNRLGYFSSAGQEEISVSCFGRNPWVIKELLHEAREAYLKKDETKTLIYRGTTSSGSTDPTWQRCMARASRPLSTVILNEKVKKDLIEDVTDYLNPATRRWYANRGIPYRRGYLFYGPPGTGKSSLAMALAGHYSRMRIYIVSLNSITANEENLASLFADLPRRCVVLLEDIDTAGLTNTREEPVPVAPANDKPGEGMVPGQRTPGNPAPTNNVNNARLSLSGLLNILDGVASQEGRILIMTTNHLEKLDKALLRPGRVDQVVKFDLADEGMIRAIFQAIYAPLEGDEVTETAKTPLDLQANKEGDAEKERKKEETLARVNLLADDFAGKIPAHEFSPAELQGLLLKHKRDPEAAIADSERWVADTRKEKQEKLLKEAEEKRKADEEKKKQEEEEKKKKEEEEKKEKEEAEKKKKEEEKEKRRKERRDRSHHRKGRRSRKVRDSEESSSSDSEEASEPETEVRDKRKHSKKGHRSEDHQSQKTETKAVEQPQLAVEEPKADAEAEVAKPVEVAITVVKTEEVGLAKGTKELADEGKHGGDSGYGTP